MLQQVSEEKQKEINDAFHEMCEAMLKVMIEQLPADHPDSQHVGNSLRDALPYLEHWASEMLRRGYSPFDFIKSLHVFGTFLNRVVDERAKTQTAQQPETIQ